MKTIWDRIHFWLKAHAPQVLAGLRPGATEAEFRAAEEAMGVRLPEEVKIVYRVHNGEGLSINCDDWFSLERMVYEWRCWKQLIDHGSFEDFKSDPRGPISTEWYHPAWLPLTGDGSGNHYCLDLAPAPGGAVGQIIRHYHDDSFRGVAADSLIDWFAEFAQDLEAGQYVFHPDYHGLVRVGDV